MIFFATVVPFFAVFLNWSPCWAISTEPRSEAVQQDSRANENLKSEIAISEKNLETHEQQARKIVSALFQIQVRMRSVVRRKSNLLQEKTTLEQNFERIKEEIEHKETKVNEQKIYLIQRMRALKSIKGQSFLQALLSAKSPNQIDSNLKILALLAAKDQRVLKEFNSSVRQIRIEYSQLSQRIKQIKSIEGKLAQQEESFRKEQERRRLILSQLQKEKRLTLEKLETLRKSSQALHMEESGVLDLFYKPSFLDQKGNLTWPVTGKLQSPFGRDQNEAFNRRLFNKGVFLSSPAGVPVNAVFPGDVAFSGEIDGLGNSIIIDHGDHFYSVYANVDHILVKPSGRVQAKQKIALAGSDPLRDRTGIYFEIRHFSEPSDPKMWMKGTL